MVDRREKCRNVVCNNTNKVREWVLSCRHLLVASRDVAKRIVEYLHIMIEEGTEVVVVDVPRRLL